MSCRFERVTGDRGVDGGIGSIALKSGPDNLIGGCTDMKNVVRTRCVRHRATRH